MATATLDIEKQELENSKIELTITVPTEIIKEASKRVSKGLLKHITVPGFRKDKTPVALVKRQIGVDRFIEFLEGELLPKTYYDALEQVNLSPISEVEYNSKQISDNSFTYKAVFSIAPAFELGDYKTMPITKPAKEAISDAEINSFLEDLQRKHAIQADVPEGGVIKEGDLVSVLIRGKIDGEDSPFLKHYNVPLVVGENKLYPDFDQNLIGKAKLDRFNIDYTFKEDHANKALAGKTADLEIKILSIKILTIPEWNEELLKKVGNFSDLEELKKAVLNSLESKKDEELNKQSIKDLQDNLYKIIDCNVPENLVNSLSEVKIEDLKLTLQHQQRGSLDDHCAALGMSLDEFRQGIDKDSERELKLSFALTKIADLENLAVSDEEANYRIHYTANAVERPAYEIMEYINDHGRYPLIKTEIKQEKALKYLQNHYFPVEKDSETQVTEASNEA